MLIVLWINYKEPTSQIKLKNGTVLVCKVQLNERTLPFPLSLTLFHYLFSSSCLFNFHCLRVNEKTSKAKKSWILFFANKKKGRKPGHVPSDDARCLCTGWWNAMFTCLC